MIPPLHHKPTNFHGAQSTHFQPHQLKARSIDESTQAIVITVLVIIGFLVFISIITTAIRCYSRIRFSRVFTLEDYLAVFAWAFGVVLAALGIVSILYSIGGRKNLRRDLSNVSRRDHHYPVVLLKLNGTEEQGPSWEDQMLLLTGPVLPPMIHITGVTMIKLSLLLFYRRLVPSDRFRAICMGTIVFVVASWVGIMGVLLFQCKPFWALWQVRTISTAKCLKGQPIYMAIAVLGAFADTVVFILPIPVVIRSGLPKGQKRHVLCVFFLGVIVLFASFARVALVSRTINTKHKDISRRILVTVLAGIAELQVAVIVACLPACKMFMAKTFNIFVMPTTPEYIWTPDATACKRAEIRMRDLENGDTMISGPSDSQTELRAATIGMRSEDDCLTFRTDHTRGSVVESGK